MEKASEKWLPPAHENPRNNVRSVIRPDLGIGEGFSFEIDSNRGRDSAFEDLTCSLSKNII